MRALLGRPRLGGIRSVYYTEQRVFVSAWDVHRSVNRGFDSDAVDLLLARKHGLSDHGRRGLLCSRAGSIAENVVRCVHTLSTRYRKMTRTGMDACL